VNTISWHIDNPVTGKNAWNRTPAVHRVLPGGSHHAEFVKRLDEAADFLGSLEGSDGRKIPVIFRPYH
jgi:mannan endo-1,4-beta-mannosidase